MAEEAQAILTQEADAGRTPARRSGLWKALAGLGSAALIGTMMLVERPASTPGDHMLRSTQLEVMDKAQTFRTCATKYIAPCMGALEIKGIGKAWIIQAGSESPESFSAPVVMSGCDSIMVPMTGRAYFGRECTPTTAPFYSPNMYATYQMGGGKFEFTIDVSQAECGCIAAVYMSGMNRNTAKGNCVGDYYCDASNVCGSSCEEFDIIEANKHAIKTTAHYHGDKDGKSAGIGGGNDELSPADYGPGSTCIDTNKPFKVAVTFTRNENMIIELEQPNNGCTKRVFGVNFPNLNNMLLQGMTPVVSYWSSPDTQWFDGPNCQAASTCGPVVTLSDFSFTPDAPLPALPEQSAIFQARQEGEAARAAQAAAAQAAAPVQQEPRVALR